jgi:peroxiredoxin
MARTLSTMLELGTRAPGFKLPDPATGEQLSLDELSNGRGLLVAFVCNHCPFVKHIQKGFAEFAKEYQAKGMKVVAISANDVKTHPDDAPELMAVEARNAGYTFPYLYDQTQTTALAYRAACTPDFFLFNADLELVYRGQFDDSRPGNDVPVSGKDLRAAADALLAGTPVASEQKPSMGCNIKWKAGNAPDY